jgi:hypothetical protein
MTPQEWLEAGREFHFETEGVDIAEESVQALLSEVDRLTALLAHSQETVKTLAEECERLNSRKIRLAYKTADYPFHQDDCKIIDYGYSDNVIIVGCPDIEEKLQAAGARAAQHLVDQDLLVAQEMKRVAVECAEIAENHQCQEFADGCGTARFIARTIRAKYGVES